MNRRGVAPWVIVLGALAAWRWAGGGWESLLVAGAVVYLLSE